MASRETLQNACAPGSVYEHHHATFLQLAQTCEAELRFEHGAAIRHYLAQLAADKSQPAATVANLRRDALRVELQFRQQLVDASLWPTAALLEAELDALVREADERRAALQQFRLQSKQALPSPNLVTMATLQQLQLAVRKQFGQIREFLHAFFCRLMESCVAQCGEPPCAFALIGLGSFARDECTLHSDLECCILLAHPLSHRDKEYFCRVTRLLFLKLLRLGETVLPSLAIPELNGAHLPPDAWRFFDGVTRRGLGLDGFMPDACKTPLGNHHLYSSQEDARAHGHELFELIHTPTEMVEQFFRGADAQAAVTRRSDALARHHAVMQDVLLTFSPIWATQGGQHLAADYLLLLEQYRHQSGHSSVRQCLRTLQQDADRFQATFRTASGTPLSVKPELYRLLERVACGVAAVHQLPLRLQGSSSLQRVDDLVNAGVLVEAAGAADIRFAVCTAMYLRLRAYLLSNRAVDVAGVLTAQDFATLQLIPASWIQRADSPLFTLFLTITAVADAVANFCLYEGTQPHWLKPAQGFCGLPHVRNSVRLRLMQHNEVFQQDPTGVTANAFLRQYAGTSGSFDAVAYLDGQLQLIQWADSGILAEQPGVVLPVLQDALQLHERVMMRMLHAVRSRTTRLSAAYAAEQMARVHRDRLAQLHHSLGTAQLKHNESSPSTAQMSSAHANLVHAASQYAALSSPLASAKSLGMLAMVEHARGEALLKFEADWLRKWHYLNAHRWFALARDAFRSAAQQGDTSLADELMTDQNQAHVFGHEGRHLEQRALLQRSIGALRSCFRDQPHPMVASLLHQLATTFCAAPPWPPTPLDEELQQTLHFVQEAITVLDRLPQQPMTMLVRFNCLSLRADRLMEREKFDDAAVDLESALALVGRLNQPHLASQARTNQFRLRALSNPTHASITALTSPDLEVMVDDAVCNGQWSQAVAFTQLLIQRAGGDPTLTRRLTLENECYKQRSNLQLFALSKANTPRLDTTLRAYRQAAVKHAYARVLSLALTGPSADASCDPLMHHSYHLLVAGRVLEAVGVLAAALAAPQQRGGRATRQLYHSMATAEMVCVRAARVKMGNNKKQAEAELCSTALCDVLPWRHSLFELRARVRAVVLSPMRGPVPDSALVRRALRLGGSWLRQWMTAAVNRCILLLRRDTHMPPSFELISFGSAARGEATPYSDVEYGILVPDGTTAVQLEWLRQLATLLHIQCMYMLETPLSDLALETGAGAQVLAASRFNYKGFSFDGRMPQACKTPLGNAHVRNAAFQFELIQTSQDMARKYTSAEAFSHDPHLVSTLSVADSLYCHGPFLPDPHPLLSQYRACCGAETAVAELRARVSQLLLMDLARHEPFGAQVGVAGNTLSLKYSSLRLLTLAMQHLAMLYLPVPRPTSTAEVIAALHAAGHLSSGWREELEWLLTQQLQLRLQHHALTHCMKDTVHFREDDELAAVAQLAGSRVYAHGIIASLYIAHVRFFYVLKQFWLQLQAPAQSPPVFLASLPSLHRFTSEALSRLSPTLSAEALRHELLATCWTAPSIQSVPRWLATESEFAAHLDDVALRESVLALMAGSADTTAANRLAMRWKAMRAGRAATAPPGGTSASASSSAAPLLVKWDESRPASLEDRLLRAQLFLANGEPRMALAALRSMQPDALASPWPLDEVRRLNEEARANVELALHPDSGVDEREPLLDAAETNVAAAQSLLAPLHLQDTRLRTDGMHQLSRVLKERGGDTDATALLHTIVELDSRIYGARALQLADTSAQLAERVQDSQQGRLWLAVARRTYETNAAELGHPFTREFVTLQTKSGGLDLRDALALGTPQASRDRVAKALTLLHSARQSFEDAIKLAATCMPACAKEEATARLNLHSCNLLLTRAPFSTADAVGAAGASARLLASSAAQSASAAAAPVQAQGTVDEMYKRGQLHRSAHRYDDAEREFRAVVTALESHPTLPIYPSALNALAATLLDRASRTAISAAAVRGLAEEAWRLVQRATPLARNDESRKTYAHTACACMLAMCRHHPQDHASRARMDTALAALAQLGGDTTPFRRALMNLPARSL